MDSYNKKINTLKAKRDAIIAEMNNEILSLENVVEATKNTISATGGGLPYEEVLIVFNDNSENIAAVEATLSETPLAEENIQTELSEEVIPATAQDVDRLTNTTSEEAIGVFQEEVEIPIVVEEEENQENLTF